MHICNNDLWHQWPAKMLDFNFFDFEQNVIHTAIDPWRDCLRSCVCTGGGQQGCSLDLNVSVSRRSFQTSRSHFGFVETWEGLGLDLVSDRKSCLGLVSVSYYRVSFTGQYAQLFASLQNCTYIILNARRLYCLLIHEFNYLLQCKSLWVTKTSFLSQLNMATRSTNAQRWSPIPVLTKPDVG